MFKRIRNWINRLTVSPATARKLWAKALRSGKFRQTKHRLCRDSGYCCLGVACEVYQSVIGGLDRVAAGTTDGEYYDGEVLHLPEKVARWLDISQGGSLREQVRECNDLVDCNDEAEMTFDEIAEVIESDKLNTWKEAHA